MNKKNLIDFEKEVIKEFKKGETYGPVHLSGGNEDELIKIFKDIKPQDWVFSTHRSHYHALLKSNDPEWLMDEIIKKANSSHINSKKYKIFTSAIVGGNIPIALGTAMGIKLSYDRLRKTMQNMKGKNFKVIKDSVKLSKIPHVWCFVGDMASEMGCFNEAIKYAYGERLPITFIIENNGLGCNTPTNKVWKDNGNLYLWPNVEEYEYKRKYPHYGIGEWVTMSNELKSKGDYQAK